MPRGRVVFAAALAILGGACSSPRPAPAENESAQTGTAEPDNSSPSEPGQAGGPDQVNGSIQASDDPGPPPDAVSHPDGYLPNASDLPPTAAAEPAPGKESPPATEDEYMRNRQSGRQARP